MLQVRHITNNLSVISVIMTFTGRNQTQARLQLYDACTLQKTPVPYNKCQRTYNIHNALTPCVSDWCSYHFNNRTCVLYSAAFIHKALLTHKELIHLTIRYQKSDVLTVLIWTCVFKCVLCSPEDGTPKHVGTYLKIL
jgi:hypothetical protein